MFRRRADGNWVADCASSRPADCDSYEHARTYPEPAGHGEQADFVAHADSVA